MTKCANDNCSNTDNLWDCWVPTLCGECLDKLVRNCHKYSPAEWEAAAKSGKTIAELIERIATASAPASSPQPARQADETGTQPA